MIYGSVCSGIEAATAAWHPLGWQPSFFSEIDNFPRAVLQHHYPEVPLHGDFTTIQAGQYRPIDLLVGGTPCQSFSIAGLRGGLDDDRGNLALEYLRLADRLRPRWLVWENVPGVLSSNGGRDFGSILGGMVELGYGIAYRVLDAQFFGVAQRRRRVFVVGYLGDWRRAAAVLFERHGLSGHPAPRRQERSAVAALTASGVGTCGVDDNQAQAGHLIEWPAEVSPTLNAAFGSKLGLENQHINGGAGMFVPAAFSIMPMNSGKDYKARPVEVSQPLMAGGPVGGNQGGDFVVQPIPFDTTQITSPANGSRPDAGDPCHPLSASAHAPAIAFDCKGTEVQTAIDGVNPPLRSMGHLNSHQNAGGHAAVQYGSAVRRLTPRECERLQGFPDDFTAIPWRGKPADQCPDGPRYKAIGNSMAVPVMRWIGQRIQEVDVL